MSIRRPRFAGSQRRSLAFAAALFVAVWAVGSRGHAADGPATPAEAAAFLERANARLLELSARAERAAWVQATYITDDTEQIAAEARGAQIAATMELASEARRFDGVTLPEDSRRQLLLLKLSLPMPAPRDAHVPPP